MFFDALMNAWKVGLKINFKKTKILHAGHDSQPRPVTMLNGYTLELCNEFPILVSRLKRPKRGSGKINGAWLDWSRSPLRHCYVVKRMRPIVKWCGMRPYY